MGRISRNQLSRGCDHVYNRGLNATWVLQDEADRDRFISIFQRLAAKYSVSVYHYCIMSNHFHFALSGEISEISSLIGGVCSSYGKYWHSIHKNGYGPIWQGRFKCILVQKELYLNRLGRYIERNPLRAGIEGICGCEDYRWSSARAYLTPKTDPLVLPEVHPYRSNWGTTPGERQKNYALYLNVDEHEDIMIFRSTEACLGDKEFQSSFALKCGRPHLRSGRPSQKQKLHMAPLTYLYDGNGNVIASVKYGNITDRLTYEPFGKQTNDTKCLFSFSTKNVDESNKSYYGHRFYDFIYKRWLTRDPVQEMGGKNLYAFVKSPIGSYDVFGLASCSNANETETHSWWPESITTGGVVPDLLTGGLTGTRQVNCNWWKTVQITWRCPCSCFVAGTSGTRDIKVNHNRTATVNGIGQPVQRATTSAPWQYVGGTTPSSANCAAVPEIAGTLVNGEYTCVSK